MFDQLEQRSLETNGLMEVANFSIQANGKAFRILISGLYSNKIQSIMREICSNAFDSHTVAGIPDRPFAVRLPSKIEESFAVRDYGVSLTHAQVMGLYATVFQSTKDQDNTSVGKFGLGSKTPFAYADNFTVAAILDGKKRIYDAFMDTDSVPKIALLTEEDTDEERGVEISFPVKTQDIKAFTDAAREVFRGFDVQPIANIELEAPPKILYEGADWYLPEAGPNDYYNRKSYVQQGCVLYPIDSTQVPSELHSLGIVVRVPIGTVDITPSRESLSYDNRTKSNLKAVLRRVELELAAMLSKPIGNASSALEAALRYKELYNSRTLRNSNMRQLISARWRGRNLNSMIGLTKAEVQRLRDLGCVMQSYHRRSHHNGDARVEDRKDLNIGAELSDSGIPHPKFIIAYYYGEKSPPFLLRRLRKLHNRCGYDQIILMPNFDPTSAGFRRFVAGLTYPSLLSTRMIGLDNFDADFDGGDLTMIKKRMRIWENRAFRTPTTSTRLTERSTKTPIPEATAEHVYFVTFTVGQKWFISPEYGNNEKYVSQDPGNLHQIWEDTKRVMGLPDDAILLGVPQSEIQAMRKHIPEHWLGLDELLAGAGKKLSKQALARTERAFQDWKTRNRYQRINDLFMDVTYKKKLKGTRLADAYKRIEDICDLKRPEDQPHVRLWSYLRAKNHCAGFVLRDDPLLNIPIVPGKPIRSIDDDVKAVLTEIVQAYPAFEELEGRRDHLAQYIRDLDELHKHRTISALAEEYVYA